MLKRANTEIVIYKGEERERCTKCGCIISKNGRTCQGCARREKRKQDPQYSDYETCPICDGLMNKSNVCFGCIMKKYHEEHPDHAHDARLKKSDAPKVKSQDKPERQEIVPQDEPKITQEDKSQDKPERQVHQHVVAVVHQAQDPLKLLKAGEDLEVLDCYAILHIFKACPECGEKLKPLKISVK